MTEPIVNVYPPAGTPGWVNGVFILLGALAGGGLTLLSTKFSDKRRFTHETTRLAEQIEQEDRRRQNDKVVEISSRLVSAIARSLTPVAGGVQQKAMEIEAMMKSAVEMDPDIDRTALYKQIDPPAQIIAASNEEHQEWKRASDEAIQAYTELSFIGPKRLSEPAYDLLDKSVKLKSVKRGQDEEAVKAAAEAYGDALQLFTNTLRVVINVQQE